MKRRAVPIALSAVLVTGLLVTQQPASAGHGAAAAGTDGTVLGAADAAGLPAVTTPTTITLVTGDKVTLSPGPDGVPVVSTHAVPRPDGLRPGIRVIESRNRRLVLPQDAIPHLASGRLDPTLFDLGYLVANGYSDKATSTLPLITQLSRRSSPAGLRAAAAAVPGLAPTTALSSLNASAGKVPKAQAASFWGSISSGTRITTSFKRGVAKVWLDRRMRADLDKSVPQIGAPKAWSAGYDGKGVKVAVLDTGIDPNHPDLKGRVTQAKNFTPDADTTDGHGHGTHVASTITGSGAASAGKYKGVAPAVDLMVGKVLDNSGSGLESGVIAGMEWAAGQGAKVINLSLGGPGPLNEADDAGAMAVDRLTASTGALFVIAAGNAGGKSTVTSPGVAESALTVASVDKNDSLAQYSSRGPLRYPDRLNKPDIAGPGSGILAARAAGTSMGEPVNESYTAANGTSMATPHVAGAAAILAQRHPSWTGEQLKAALMSTSQDVRYNAFEQGAGRVDVARAVGQQVVSATSGVDFGRIPDTEQGELVRQITYRNDSATDVTLTLTDALKNESGADLGSALSTPEHVLVPAGGTASVDVKLSAATAGTGLASGAVVASADGIQVRTPVTMLRSIKTYPVQIDVKFSAPTYFGPVVNGLYLEDSTAYEFPTQYATIAPDRMSASITVDLPPGRWHLSALGDRMPASQRLEDLWLVNPEVDVQGPTVVELSDKTVVPFGMSSDRPTQPIGGGWIAHRVGTAGKNWLTETAHLSQYADAQFLATPTAAVTVGSWWMKFQSTRGTPRVQLTVDSANGRGLAMTPNYWFHASSPLRFDGRWRKLPLVDLGWSIEPGELASVRGKLVLMSFTWGHGGYECDLSEATRKALKDAGAVGVIQEAGSCQLYPRSTDLDILPVAGVDANEGAALHRLLAAGPVTVQLTGVPTSPVVQHLVTRVENRIPASLKFHVDERKLARIATTYSPDGELTSRGGHENVGQRLVPAQEPALYAWPTFVHMPQTREVQYGPIEPGQQWIRSVTSTYDLVTMEERRTILRPGRMPAERWLAAPRSVGPSDVPPAATNLTHLGFCFACRDGDRLTVVPQYAFSDPVTLASMLLGSAQTKLYRNGQKVAGGKLAGMQSFELQPGRARYKLVVDSDLTGVVDMYRHAAKQHTEWTFESEQVKQYGMGNTTCYANWVQQTPAAACAPAKLLYLRYSGSGRHLRITPYYERSSRVQTAAFKSVKVRASYDGKSWVTVPGITLRGSHNLLVLPPRGAKSVTLKVDASDREGNTISQTLENALPLTR